MSFKDKENREIKIIIEPIVNRETEYLAYYESKFLKATFSVYIHDNIFGALALNKFAEMIKEQYYNEYRNKRVEFIISDEPVNFKNRAILDVISSNNNFSLQNRL